MVSEDRPPDRAILRRIVADLDQNVGVDADVTKPGRFTTGDPMVVGEA